MPGDQEQMPGASRPIHRSEHEWITDQEKNTGEHIRLGY